MKIIKNKIKRELSPNMTDISINVNGFNSRSKDTFQKSLNKTKKDTFIILKSTFHIQDVTGIYTTIQQHLPKTETTTDAKRTKTNILLKGDYNTQYKKTGQANKKQRYIRTK